MTKEELVYLCHENGILADVLTPEEDIASVLGGITPALKEKTEICCRAIEIEKFVRANEYRLSLDCDKHCVTCSTGLILWCFDVLPQVKERLDEAKKVDEEIS